jgi:predicted methyltransferase
MQLTEKVHQLLSEHLQLGDLTIDATAGNGYDTQLLAEKVGTEGTVIAIDIQGRALEATRAKLAAAQLTERAIFHCADHAIQLEVLLATHSSTVAAIVFNLGYLPGSDKSIQTESTNTQKALDAAYQLLRKGGLLCVTAYRGHPGGMEEAQAVAEWMQAQKAIGHQVESHQPPASNNPPILWVLTKRSGP